MTENGFHVVAQLYGGDPEEGPGTLPCWMSGTMFLCPGSYQFENGELVPSAFEMPERVAGRWPDAVWKLDDFDTDMAWSLFTLDPQKLVWKKVGARLPERWSDTSGYLISPWTPGSALVLEQAMDDRPGMPPLRIRLMSPGSKAPTPTLNRDGKQLLGGASALAAFESGAVVVLGSTADLLASRSAIWRPGETMPTMADLGAEECSAYRLFAPAIDDLVAVGEGSGGTCGYQFNGKQWSKLELPSGKAARGYARQADGTEWVVLHTESSGRGATADRGLELWSRRRNSSWTRMALPLPLTIPAAARCSGYYPDGDVWAGANGDVWVRVRMCESCGLFTNLLLHNKRPKHVCRQEDWNSKCAPIAEHQVRLHRCEPRSPKLN